MDDPSAMIQFFDEINRRTDEAISDCAKTWVNQAARKRFHAAIHETVKTVFVALLNDLLELQRDLGEQILESEDTIPTVEQIAESLPRLFSEAGEGTDDARKRSVERVKWVWTQWLQLQIRVHQLLPTVEEIAASRERNLPGSAPPTDAAADFEEPFLILGCLFRLKELTYEYLDARAAAMHAYGKPAIGMSVEWENSPDALIALATKAYHRGEPSATHLLLLALRGALLDHLGLRGLDPRFDIRGLATTDLVGVAMEAGVEFPLGAMAVGNVVASLEIASSRAEPVANSLLLPLVRVSEHVVGRLAATKPSGAQLTAVRRRLGVPA